MSAALLQRPMLLIGGWYDPHLRGVLELWRQARQAGGEPRLHVGAWSHLNWQGGVDQRQLAFFRRHLQHEPHAGEPFAPIQLQCQTTGAWQTPSPDQLQARRALHWGLRSTGLAAVEASEGELLPETAGGGIVAVVHDPWRAVPGRGGHLGLDAGPCERADLDGRCDVACFTSPPMAKPLELLGRPVLQLGVQADQPGFDLCAALSRVGPDGRVEQLSTGVLRQLGDGCLHAQTLQLELQPLCAALAPGDRLRLSLAGAAWPQIAVNPGDGTLPRGGASPAHRVITLSLQLSDARLELQPLVASASGQLGQTGRH